MTQAICRMWRTRAHGARVRRQASLREEMIYPFAGACRAIVAEEARKRGDRASGRMPAHVRRLHATFGQSVARRARRR